MIVYIVDLSAYNAQVIEISHFGDLHASLLPEAHGKKTAVEQCKSN
jgi:hypothetical protein